MLTDFTYSSITNVSDTADLLAWAKDKVLEWDAAPDKREWRARNSSFWHLSILNILVRRIDRGSVRGWTSVFTRLPQI